MENQNNEMQQMIENFTKEMTAKGYSILISAVSNDDVDNSVNVNVKQQLEELRREWGILLKEP